MALVIVVLTVMFASMPVYALLAKNRHDTHEIESRGSFVFGGFVRNWFYWFIGPIERVSIIAGLPPTAYNVTGALCGCLAGYCFGTGQVGMGGWLVLLGGAADVLDGRVARARGLASQRGAFLDSTLDRFAEVGVFVGLAVLYMESVPELAVVVAALGGSLLVSYTRARGESLGVTAKVGVMQRAERLLLVGLGAVLDPGLTSWQGWPTGAFLFWLLALVAIGTLGTAVYRTVWIARRLD